MTQSIFDPGGPNTERSGSRNLGPDASQGSQMPSDVTDGVVSEEEAAEYRAAGLEPPQPASDLIDMGEEGNAGVGGVASMYGEKPGTPDDSLLKAGDDFSNPGGEARS